MKTSSSVSILILSVILSVGFVVTPSYADQLKPGMANTVSLADGSVVYDLSGEWDAVIDNKQFGIRRIAGVRSLNLTNSMQYAYKGPWRDH